jgi:hypothetical protein
MTINLLTGVPAGMVLLTDSMLTLGAPGSTMVTTFENAEKLVVLGREPTPAAAMISGAGDVNGKLVSQLLAKVGVRMDSHHAKLRHDDVVQWVHEVVDPEWQAQLDLWRRLWSQHYSQFDELAKINADRQQHQLADLTQIEPKHIEISGATDNDPEAFIPVRPAVLTIVVASYWDEDPRATELWWPGTTVAIALPNIRWWGSGSTSVTRVVLGCDYDKLRNEAEAEGKQVSAVGGPPSDDAQRANDYLTRRKPDFQMGLPLHALPLQDAIEFTEYLGTVACGFDKFSLGPAAVGGPLDVLALHPNRRQWVHRKQIHSTLR